MHDDGDCPAAPVLWYRHVPMTRKTRKGISSGCSGRSTGGIGCITHGTNTDPTIGFRQRAPSAASTGVNDGLFAGIQT